MSNQDTAPVPKPGNQTVRNVEPVRADEPEVHDERWTGRLVIFLRVMAVLSMAKGLYHWAIVSGVTGPADGFEYQPMPWQTATVFFAVIDLVAAVGLWLAGGVGRGGLAHRLRVDGGGRGVLPAGLRRAADRRRHRGRAAVCVSGAGDPVGARASELRFDEPQGRLP